MERKTLVITHPNGLHSVALTVEVAFTDEEHQRGLMFRDALPDNDGMLFVFEEDQDLGFWMKDTYVALTVAYIDARGRILETADLYPLSEDTHYPEQPYRYALEVNRGFFKEHVLPVGSKIVLKD